MLAKLIYKTDTSIKNAKIILYEIMANKLHTIMFSCVSVCV